jgi:hypothetical protein
MGAEADHEATGPLLGVGAGNLRGDRLDFIVSRQAVNGNADTGPRSHGS